MLPVSASRPIQGRKTVVMGGTNAPIVDYSGTDENGYLKDAPAYGAGMAIPPV